MKFIRLYVRVLELLGREARLGWVLAIANLAIASVMFVEPILFGKIIDTLANSQGKIAQLNWNELMTLVGAWVITVGAVASTQTSIWVLPLRAT